MENTINATEINEIAIFERGVGEGAARVLDNRVAERERAVLSMGRRTGAAGVRAALRSLVREDFTPLAKVTREKVMGRALAILQGA